MSDVESDNSVDKSLVGATAADRQAVAEFLLRHGDRIRRLLGSKLCPAARRVFDPEDALAEVAVTIDRRLASGTFHFEHEEQLWSFVWIAGERIVRRQNALAKQRYVLAGLQSGRFDRGVEMEEELQVAFRGVSHADRELLLLWGRGLKLSIIAAYQDVSPEALRKRWERLRRQARKSRTAAERQEPRAKSQEPRAKSQEPRAYRCDPLAASLFAT